MAQQIKSYSNSQTKLIVIGEYDKHVGGYDLSPVLYYYSNLQGWTLTSVDWNMNKIEELRRKGATLLVVVPRYNADPNAVNYVIDELPDSSINEVKPIFQFLTQTGCT